MDVPPAGPLVHAALADQGVVADQLQPRIADLARHLGVIVIAVREIDQQVAAALAVERVAVQSRAQRGGQFGKDIVIPQVHPVVAGLRLLLVVARTIAWPGLPHAVGGKPGTGGAVVA